MLLTLFPAERPEYPEGAPEGDRAELSFFEGEKRDTAVCRLVLGGECFSGRASVSRAEMTDDLTRARLTQRAVSLSFYRAALASGIEKPVWGSLTGIRPGKLMSRLLEQGLSDRAAVTEFVRLDAADRARAELCLHTAHAGLAVEKSHTPRDV